MANFPALKTGAIAQYPALKRMEHPNLVLEFLDGAGQRYRESAGPLRRWLIHLDQLDEYEMARLSAFFEEQQGRAGTFAFTDPWNGQIYPDCSFESDALELASIAEMHGRTSVMVKANRA